MANLKSVKASIEAHKEEGIKKGAIHTVWVEDGQFSEPDAELITKPILIDEDKYLAIGQKVIVKRFTDNEEECIVRSYPDTDNKNYSEPAKFSLIKLDSVMLFPVTPTD